MTISSFMKDNISQNPENANDTDGNRIERTGTASSCVTPHHKKYKRWIALATLTHIADALSNQVLRLHAASQH